MSFGEPSACRLLPHMLNTIPYNEPDDWGWYIQPSIVRAVIDYRKELMFLFWWFDKYARSDDDKITSWTIFRELRLTMPRKGKSNGSTANNGANDYSGASVRNEWKWVNIKLTAQDIDVLASSDTTLEYLSACVCALANDGIGVTIKPADEGKSVRCTLDRSDYPVRGVTVGVSSFGDNVRDAILSVLYKLDHYGASDFSGFELQIPSESSRPRFR